MEWTLAFFRSCSFLMLHAMNMYILDVCINNNLVCSHHGVLGIYDKHSSINKADIMLH